MARGGGRWDVFTPPSQKKAGGSSAAGGGPDLVEDQVPMVELFPRVHEQGRAGGRISGEEDPIERRRRNIYSKLALSDHVWAHK